MWIPNQELLKELVALAFKLNAQAKRGYLDPLLKNLDCAIERAVYQKMSAPQDAKSREFWVRVTKGNIGRLSRKRARERRQQNKERQHREAEAARQLTLFP